MDVPLQQLLTCIYLKREHGTTQKNNDQKFSDFKILKLNKYLNIKVF